MELLDEELSAPADKLYPHNLAGILETAIRATNAQFEDQEILDRLDVRLLDVQPGDYGWDVFSLDYKVTGNLNLTRLKTRLYSEARPCPLKIRFGFEGKG